MKRLLKDFATDSTEFVPLAVLLIAIYAVLGALEKLTLIGALLAAALLGILYFLGILFRLSGIRPHGPE